MFKTKPVGFSHVPVEELGQKLNFNYIGDESKLTTLEGTEHTVVYIEFSFICIYFSFICNYTSLICSYTSLICNYT